MPISDTLQGDYSSMYSTTPVGDSGVSAFQRNWLGQLVSGTGFAESVDWLRNEQSANNAFVRDMLQLNEENAFNASQAELARAFEAEQAGLTREFNSSEAQKQRDFEERMSNTAYQRAVQDMQLAGLNPMLLYSQGGATSPSGMSASSTSPGTSMAYSGSSGGRGSSGSSRRGDNSGNVVSGVLRVVGDIISLVAGKVGKTGKIGFGD